MLDHHKSRQAGVKQKTCIFNKISFWSSCRSANIGGLRTKYWRRNMPAGKSGQSHLSVTRDVAQAKTPNLVNRNPQGVPLANSAPEETSRGSDSGVEDLNPKGMTA
jgi:hypothetical protein